MTMGFVYGIRRIAAFVSIHAFGQLWMSPVGYSRDRPKDYRDHMKVMKKSVQALTSVYGTHFTYGPISEVKKRQKYLILRYFAGYLSCIRIKCWLGLWELWDKIFLRIGVKGQREERIPAASCEIKIQSDTFQYFNISLISESDSTNCCRDLGRVDCYGYSYCSRIQGHFSES